jgi:hypothetical protein
MGAGNVQEMSYGMAEQFMSDTEAPSPAEGQVGEGNESVAEQAEAGEEEEGAAEEEKPTEEEAAEEDDTNETGSPVATDEDTSGTITTYTDDFLDITQDQSTKPVEEQAPVDKRPFKHFGYFVGMLTKDNSGSKEFSSALQDFDSDTISGRDGSFNYIDLDGSTDYDDPKITSLETPDGAIENDDLPVSVQHTELGHNAYMEWGYWLQPSAMSDGMNDFYFDNIGYGIFGDYTTEARMIDLAANDISGTYSGSAHGTFWTPTGGANMDGTFSSHVCFNSGSITDFGLSVSGGGHSASISGASGAFTGPTSQFAINGNTGTWEIDGLTPDTKAASGSVYGSNGDAMGGVWEIHHSATSKHAVGVFQGTR